MKHVGLRIPAAIPSAIASFVVVTGVVFGATQVVPGFTGAGSSTSATPMTAPAAGGSQNGANPGGLAVGGLHIEQSAEPTDTPTTDPTTDPTTGPTDAPTPMPTLEIALAPKSGGVVISWSKYTGDRFQYYKVVRSTDATPTWPLGSGDTLVCAVSNVAQLSCGDTEAPDGKTLTYRVFAVTSGDAGWETLAKSKIESITTPVPTAAPTSSASLSLTLSVAGSDVNLDWSGYSGDRFDYYKVVRSTDGNPTWPTSGSDQLVCVISNPAETACTDSDAPTGVVLSYRVFAVDSTDAGYVTLASTAIKQTKIPGAAPTPIPDPVSLGNLSITNNGDGTYTFSWKAYTGAASTFTYYKLVHDAPGSSPCYPGSPYWLASGNQAQTSWTGAIPSGSYAVRLQAVDYPTGSAVIVAQTAVVELNVP